MDEHTGMNTPNIGSRRELFVDRLSDVEWFAAPEQSGTVSHATASPERTAGGFL